MLNPAGNRISEHIKNFRQQPPQTIERRHFISIFLKRPVYIAVRYYNISQTSIALPTVDHLYESARNVPITYMMPLYKAQHKIKIGRDTQRSVKSTIITETHFMAKKGGMCRLPSVVEDAGTILRTPPISVTVIQIKVLDQQLLAEHCKTPYTPMPCLPVFHTENP